MATERRDLLAYVADAVGMEVRDELSGTDILEQLAEYLADADAVDDLLRALEAAKAYGQVPLVHIHAILDGREWDGTVIEEVGRIVTGAGFTVRDPNDVDDDDDDDD